MPLERYPEIDMLRTAALLMMVIYHTAYDLAAFYGWHIPVFSGGWVVLARGAAGLFLLLVGASFAISYDRARLRLPRRALWRKYLHRGLSLLGVGMLLSIATYIIGPETYIRFGVLHLIGTSILLLPLFTPLWAPLQEGSARVGFFRSGTLQALVLGMLLIGIGLVLPQGAVTTALLLPLGLMPAGFTSVDYFPLLPWFGVVLIGAALGHAFYIRTMSWREHLPILSPRLMQVFAWPGRHSLLLYLAHQPVIIGILIAILGKP